jgi:hypothetical protein
MPDKIEIVLPFSGFYESLHDALIDDAIDSLFQNDRGDTNEGLKYRVHASCDFRAVWRAYAKEYAEQFAHAHGLPSLTFKALESPREYNFTTDRIFCDISPVDVARLFAETTTETLTEFARARFTSCSGFVSFYSPDVSDWGDVTTWDHNQVGCLLAAWLRDRDGEGYARHDEIELMESPRGNGLLETWVSENTPGIERLYKIHDYLLARAERADR